MNWLTVLQIIYVLIIILVSLRIIYDTRSTTKTLAYILLVIFLPLIGFYIYFSFGINYRKRKIYSKKYFTQELEDQLMGRIQEYQQSLLTTHSEELQKYSGLIQLVSNQSFFPVTDNNAVHLLINGENKFPAVLEAIEHARHHIHIEYYIYDTDHIGMQVINLLIIKAKEGVKVRFIYDDFGSRDIRKRHLRPMREAGIEVFPFYKIRLIGMANKMNYRNHRKIIVVDGKTGFVGGINVSDKYINDPKKPDKLYWRDTHLMLEGWSVHTLQYLFLVDWNYCSKQQLQYQQQFFPLGSNKEYGNQLVQIVAGGPDSDTPLILHSSCQAIILAKEEVLITTPYFIPGETLKDILMVASRGGIKVKLLVPGISDSRWVNMANHSHFELLLEAGVAIYTYQKGFVHAKSMVIDGEIAIVGTANMDLRSFDLNFEVNAIVYDRRLAAGLRNAFFEDISNAKQIDLNTWRNRPIYRQLPDKIAGLVSPLL